MKKKIWITVICLILAFGMSIFAIRKAKEVLSEKKIIIEGLSREWDKGTENEFSLFYDRKKFCSVNVTFDSQKLMVSDEDWSDPYSIYLEVRGDVTSVLGLSYEKTTVKEINDKYENLYGVPQKPRVSTVAGLPTCFWETSDGTVFLIDLGNGMCITNDGVKSYKGKMDLEELLSYAFLDIKEGDGTYYIRPKKSYFIKDNGKKVFIFFESGGSYILDYDEDEVSTCLYNGGYFVISFHEDDLLPGALMLIYMTNKYSSIEEFDKGEGQIHESWETGLPVNRIKVKDITIEYIDNQSNKAIFFIPLKEGYALRGEYIHGRPDAPTIEEVFSRILGDEVETLQ